jgi:hypothetical protein
MNVIPSPTSGGSHGTFRQSVGILLDGDGVASTPCIVVVVLLCHSYMTALRAIVFAVDQQGNDSSANGGNAGANGPRGDGKPIARGSRRLEDGRFDIRTTPVCTIRRGGTGRRRDQGKRTQIFQPQDSGNNSNILVLHHKLFDSSIRSIRSDIRIDGSLQMKEHFRLHNCTRLGFVQGSFTGTYNREEMKRKE